MKSAVIAVPEERAEGTPAQCPTYPPDVTSLLGVLQHQWRHMPERIVCTRIVRQRKALSLQPLSVADLGVRAVRAATALQLAGARGGDRIILSLSDPHDFLVAFFSTLMAGASAVPLPTVVDSAPRSFAARVRSVCKGCRPAVAVVDGLRRFHETVGRLPPQLRLLEPADLEGTTGAPADIPEPSSSLPAFIQYTSGSTGEPKGVVITHGNILANCNAIRDATGYTRADRMVSWLPLHHDMGLVGGLLTSIYCAAETFIMPPLLFLARPVTWLEAISRCAASLTVAPTFAYSLCARKIPPKQLEGVDLSSLRLAYVGAEPIDPVTLAAFVERFSPYGLSPQAMYPVYGLAEATLAVAFPPPGRALRFDTVDRRRLAADGVAAPLARGSDRGVTFVSVGRALPGHQVEIVSRDTGQILGERRLGEVVVEGGGVSPGYFGEEGRAAGARLHTGDLGYASGGEIYVVDRIKDLVIVGGQNYAPSDIESAAATVKGLRRGRIVAFSSLGKEGTEELHVVAEASLQSWRAPREVAEEVRRRVRREIGLAVATVTIVAPGTLERTSSGKVRRRACAEAHRTGTLKPVRSRLGVVRYRIRRHCDLLLDRFRRAAGHVLACWRT